MAEKEFLRFLEQEKARKIGLLTKSAGREVKQRCIIDNRDDDVDEQIQGEEEEADEE